MVHISGAYTSAALEIKVENVTTGVSGSATAASPAFKETAGKLGFGAANFSGICTDIYFSNMKIGSNAYTGGWTPYSEVGTWQENVSVGETTVRNMAAGNENTNAIDGKAYISKTSYTGVDSTKSGTFETTFVIIRQQAQMRISA